MKVFILDCDDAKSWSPVSFGDMFRDFIAVEGDKCVVVNIAREKALPPELGDSDAVVITGSHYNCREGNGLPWFEPLCEFIRQTAAVGQPKLYGGCFGCQVIGHALGGEVDYNPSKSFVLKAENIIVDTEAVKRCTCSCSCAAENAVGLELPEKLLLIESHGDCVLRLPSDAQVLASSSSCTHEMYIAGKHRNILACQGHPEFDVQYCVYDRIWPQVVERLRRVTDEEAVEYRKTFEAYDGKDALVMRRFIAQFLRS